MALAQICGIALADFAGVTSGLALAGAWLGIVAGGLAWWHARGVWLAAVWLATCSGALAHAQQLEAARERRPAVAVERTLAATIESVRADAAGYRIDLRDVVSAGPRIARVPSRVRLYGASTPDGIHAIEARLPGERVWLAVKLRAPTQRHNPGSRSPDIAFDRAGVGAVARLIHPALHARLPAREGRRGGAWIARERAQLHARFDACGPGAGLLRALALGDRRGLAPELDAAFARLGIAHLLAVSGLHLALVAALVFGAVRLALARSATIAARWDTRGIALAAAVPAALGYALLAGWGVPVRRAAILLGGLALAFAGGRRRAAAPLLAAAAIAVLVQEPGALFQPGAQLSFLASAALIAAARRTPQTSRSRTGFAHYLESLLRASASAIAVTAPVAAWHFGRAAPFALALNLVAIPWTAAALLPAAGLALVAAMFEAGAWTDALLRFAGAVAEWTGAAVLALDRALPIVPAVGAPGALAGCALLALAVGSVAARGTRTRVLIALAITAVLVFAPPRAIEPEPPRLVVLDVGQGDAVVVQGREAAILIDAGPALRGRFDLGARVVVPALAALGIRALDLLVVTHADLDHRGGVPAVMRALPVRELWLPYGARDDASFREVLAAARDLGVRVRERGAGDAAHVFGGVRVTPLWPPPAGSAASRNDRSLVVRVDVAGSRVLLPGDIEAAAEAALMTSGADLRADVIALAHHGSRTSSSPGFIAAVGAAVATVSAPCAGRYAMPHPDVVERARAQGLPIWWTGRDGALTVGLEGPVHVAGFAASHTSASRGCGTPSAKAAAAD